MHLITPDSPSSFEWSGELYVPRDMSAELMSTEPRGPQRAGSGGMGGSPLTAVGDLPHASIGMPDIWSLAEVYAPDVVPAPVQALLTRNDFYFCRLACSFRPKHDETLIRWARLIFALLPDDEGHQPIVFDLDPVEVHHEEKRGITMTLSPSLKFEKVEASLGSVGFSFEYTFLRPVIWADGPGEETANWYFERTRSETIQGGKWMHLLIKAPRNTTTIRANLGIVAEVMRRGIRAQVLGGRSSTGDTRSVTLWPRS